MRGEQEDVSSHPLVIVRRRRNTEEEHHGGVWKIAYADFMTAMMAFFLVMWLINAADRKTIIQVASYFNPMRLTDRHAEPKGLRDLVEDESRGDRKGIKGKGSEKQIDHKKKLQADHTMREKVGEGLDKFARKTNAAAGGKSFEVQKEQALFDDPGKLLERLASQAKASQPTTASSPVDGNLSDPFDRLNRRSGKAQPLAKPLPPTVPGAKNQYAASKQPSNVKPEDAAKDAQKNSTIGKAVGVQAPAPTPKPAQAAAAKPSVEGKIEAKKQALSALPANVQQAAKELAALEIKKRDEAREQAKKDAEVKEEAKAEKLESDISSAISRVSRDLPNVEVKATPEGLLVSLTDDANFGMFEVGSAKPRPELVVTMSKVGEVLEKVGGKIVVRGHTDSRAYRNGNYDNWRLSSARAQMAYYMLIRGGLDKSRVVAIEGRADRDPKISSDPEAAQNRRIEILIKEDKQ